MCIIGMGGVADVLILCSEFPVFCSLDEPQPSYLWHHIIWKCRSLQKKILLKRP